MTSLTARPAPSSVSAAPAIGSSWFWLRLAAGLLFGLWLILPAQASTPIEFAPGQLKLGLGGAAIDYLEDPSGQWRIEDVSSEAFRARFLANTQSRPNFGFTRHPVWLRFTIRQQDPRGHYLEFGYPPLDRIDLFLPSVNGYQQKTAGDAFPFAQREINHRNHVFRLPPRLDDYTTYYVRVQTSGSFTLPITLWHADGFTNQTGEEHLGLGLYYGMLLALFAYNLLLYFSIRDQNYLHYCVFLATTGIMLMAVNGLGAQYLWPHATWWNDKSPLVMLEAGTLSACYFSRLFLNSKQHTPKLDRVLLLTIWVELIMIVSTLTWLDYRLAAQMASTLSNVAPLLIMWTAIVTWRQGYRPARYFLISWTAYLAGLMLFTLRNFGVFPSHPITIYALQIGSAMEMLLLSFALADRFNELKRDKERAQQFALETLLESEKHLESKVAARTTELSLANGRLATTVQQLARLNQEKNEILGIAAHDLKTPLTGVLLMIKGTLAQLEKSRIETLHSTLATIRDQVTYMLDIIGRLLNVNAIESGQSSLHPEVLALDAVLIRMCDQHRLWAESKQINLHLDAIHPTTVLADRHALQEVLDNLLSNAIKFSRPGSEVRVACENDGPHAVCRVKDGGPGISASDMPRLFGRFTKLSARPTGNEDSTGLGLSIVKRLVEEMNGTINCTSPDGEGATFEVLLPGDKFE